MSHKRALQRLTLHTARPLIPRTPVQFPTLPCPRCRRAFTLSAIKFNETTPQTRLQSDLKAALRAKDKARLTVLRALLAELTNASKTSKPITTDSQLLSVIRKKLSAADDAIKEAHAVSRQDLAEKESQEKAILEEYVKSLGGGETPPERITELARNVINELKETNSGKKLVMGDVLKRLLGPGGSLEGKADGRSVATAVKQLMS